MRFGIPPLVEAASPLPTLCRLPLEVSEKHMSDKMVSILLTLVIVALFFAWVPLLEWICPPCGRFLERIRPQKDATKKRSV